MEHSAGSLFFTIVFYFSVNKRNELDCTIYYGRSSAANILISHLLYIALHYIILYHDGLGLLLRNNWNENDLRTYMLTMARTMQHEKDMNQKKREVSSILLYIVVHHVHILFYLYPTIFFMIPLVKSLTNGLQKRFSVIFIIF